MLEAVDTKSLISATEELLVSISKLTAFCDEISEGRFLIDIPRLRRHQKASEKNSTKPNKQHYKKLMDKYIL